LAAAHLFGFSLCGALYRYWYKIKFKPIVSHCGGLPEKLLVWFSEITTQKEALMRQHDLLNYTGGLMSDIKTLARKKSTYDHLAAYILNNYEGVFITRNDPDGNLAGYVLKRNGEIKRSENIVIDRGSYSPIRLSRRTATVTADDVRNYSSASTFNQKYGFDKRVRSFLDVPIRNFINYHQTFNGKGYPRLKKNGVVQPPLYKDYAEYLKNSGKKLLEMKPRFCGAFRLPFSLLRIFIQRKWFLTLMFARWYGR
jgi:hypothetical protein